MSSVGEEEMFAIRHIRAAFADWQVCIHILIYMSISAPCKRNTLSAQEWPRLMSSTLSDWNYLISSNDYQQFWIFHVNQPVAHHTAIYLCKSVFLPVHELKLQPMRS
ncbi:hypothetical protein AZE42_10278 [Rhizopogon vesiculosus]|uniref:Uncharacterized protein n=1 Tax=Rhizopogon vesiculosus TaxID=180088 RepID=A0A1J8PQD5_9AGAM|nr:hypothetical protein AZE42_10278 [Rhizopogon vesiculosus]